MKAINLLGQRFARLLVVNYNGKRGQYRMWKCLCDCGKTTIVRGGHLRRGKISSCGCFRSDVVRTHGESRTGLHALWTQMRQRCTNQKSVHYAYYGGRGISVCERWQKFENFKADMGPRPTKHHTVDRIDNDGNYEPANCRWSTRTEQMNNTRRNRTITAFGQTKTLVEWSRVVVPHVATISRRLAKGIPAELALSPRIRKDEKSTWTSTTITQERRFE